MAKLWENIKYVLINQVLVVVLPLLTSPYLARVLGIEGIGLNASLNINVALFMTISLLSIPIYGVREISKCKSEEERSEVFFSIYKIQLIMHLIIFVSFLLFITFFSEHFYLFLLQGIALISALLNVNWFFNGKMEAKRIAMRNTGIRVVSVLLIFSFVHQPQHLYRLILINVLTSLMGELIMWIPLIKELDFNKVNTQSYKKHIYPIFISFLPFLFINIYTKLNASILGFRAGDIELGFYSQANNIIQMILGFVFSVNIVLLPKMAKSFSEDSEEVLRSKITKNFQLVFLISFLIILVFNLTSKSFVLIMFGEEFLPTSLLLRVFTFKILLMGLSNIMGKQILIAKGNEMKFAFSAFCGMFVSLPLNIFLISYMGAMGTVIAVLTAEIVVVTIQFFFTNSFLDKKRILFDFFKYFSIALTTFVIVLFLSYQITDIPIIRLLIQSLLAGTFYLAFLLAIKDSFLMNILMSLKVQKK